MKSVKSYGRNLNQYKFNENDRNSLRGIVSKKIKAISSNAINQEERLGQFLGKEENRLHQTAIRLGETSNEVLKDYSNYVASHVKTNIDANFLSEKDKNILFNIIEKSSIDRYGDNLTVKDLRKIQEDELQNIYITAKENKKYPITILKEFINSSKYSSQEDRGNINQSLSNKVKFRFRQIEDQYLYEELYSPDNQEKLNSISSLIIMNYCLQKEIIIPTYTLPDGVKEGYSLHTDYNINLSLLNISKEEKLKLRELIKNKDQAFIAEKKSSNKSFSEILSKYESNLRAEAHNYVNRYSNPGENSNIESSKPKPNPQIQNPDTSRPASKDQLIKISGNISETSL